MSSFGRDVIFMGDGMSKNFYDVLPDRLTLRNPIPEKFHDSFGGYCHDTIFKEVSFNKYKHTDEAKEWLHSSPGKTKNIHELYNTLKRVIEKHWDTTKTHIIGHSSGYDSRVMSNIIKELGEKNGKEWLGEVLCIENLGEGVQFQKIMNIQGLKGIVYNEGANPRLHHKYSFNFKTFYKKFNGVVSFPINLWYDSYKHLEEQGIISSENVQCFTGYGANEAMEIAHKDEGFNYYFKWHHYLQIQRFNLWGDNWVYPYWDYEFLTALAGFAEAKGWRRRIAGVMADKMVPHLVHIPVKSLKDIGKMGYRTLPNNLLRTIIENFKKSWYGRQVRVHIQKDFTNYRSWWTHYCIASVCEHLLERGHKITRCKYTV